MRGGGSQEGEAGIWAQISLHAKSTRPALLSSVVPAQMPAEEESPHVGTVAPGHQGGLPQGTCQSPRCQGTHSVSHPLSICAPTSSEFTELLLSGTVLVVGGRGGAGVGKDEETVFIPKEFGD